MVALTRLTERVLERVPAWVPIRRMNNSLEIGQSGSRDNDPDFALNVSDGSPGMVIAGEMVKRHIMTIAGGGSGRLAYMGHLIRQIVKAPTMRACIFDPHGEYFRQYARGRDVLISICDYADEPERFGCELDRQLSIARHIFIGPFTEPFAELSVGNGLMIRGNIAPFRDEFDLTVGQRLDLRVVAWQVLSQALCDHHFSHVCLDTISRIHDVSGLLDCANRGDAAVIANASSIGQGGFALPAAIANRFASFVVFPQVSQESASYLAERFNCLPGHFHRIEGRERRLVTDWTLPISEFGWKATQ